MYQNFPSQDPPKVSQIGIYGLKKYHLATLLVIAQNFTKNFKNKLQMLNL
jgi:hypothetical protein